jgi:hypothetical protein
MGDPNLVADTNSIRSLGVYFTNVGSGKEPPLKKADQDLTAAVVPDDAFGHLPMSDTLRSSYKNARDSHLHNLALAMSYFTSAGGGLHKVAAQIYQAEKDSTL